MNVDIPGTQLSEWIITGATALVVILFGVIWQYHRKQFSDAEDRMNKLESRIDELFAKKLSGIEKDLGIVQTDVKNLEDKVDEHNRIYEHRLSELITSALTPISSKLDSLNDKLT